MAQVPVDPRLADRRSVEQLVLGAGHFRSTGKHHDQIALAILPDVTIDLRLVWPPAGAP